MKIRTLLVTTGFATAMALAAPAVANDPEIEVEIEDVLSDNQVVDDGNGNVQNEDSFSIDDSGNDLLSNNDDNGNNRDNEFKYEFETETEFNTTAANNGSMAADRGGEIYAGNNEIVAEQTLIAVNANWELDEVMDLDGVDGEPSDAGYHSGSNSVNGNAFSAYAGILNQAWNTGVNANTQAATNIAAQGTVTFGSNGCCEPAGSGGSGGGD